MRLISEIHLGHPCDITIDDKDHTNSNGGCAQICNKNGENVVCSCMNGYQLGDDGKSCDPGTIQKQIDIAIFKGQQFLSGA